MPAQEPHSPVRANALQRVGVKADSAKGVGFDDGGSVGPEGSLSELPGVVRQNTRFSNGSMGSGMGVMRRMSTSMWGGLNSRAAKPIDPEEEAERAKRELEQLSSSVQRALKNYGKGIIHPRTAKWVQYWDAMSFLCLFYTAVVTPFEVGLLQPMPLSMLLDDINMFALFACNRIVDIFFFCDMVMNFFLAYQEPTHRGGMWVTSRAKIANNYLHTWFFLDFISVIPIDLLMGAFREAESPLSILNRSRAEDESIGAASDIELLRAMRIIRLLRLVKLLRILRASRILARWQNFIGVSYAIMTMIRFLTMTIFVVHFMACAWGYMGLNWEPTPGDTLEWETTWLEEYGFDALSSTRRLYVISLYVAVCSMFGSVGSIQPSNYAEFVLITMMMIIGSTVWAWVIGSLCGILATLNPHATQFQNLMDELNFFMKANDFTGEHRVRLREFFRQMQEFSRIQTYDKLMLKMSAQLRGDTALKIAKSNLEHIWYFNEIELEQEFLALVALNMHVTVYEMREVMPTIDLTVIDRGVVARRLVMLTKGAVLGLDCVISERHANLRPLEAAYSLTFVQASTISRAALFSITEHFPEAMKALTHASAIYTLKSAFRLAWTAHKRMLRAKGLARARVSNTEIHEGALKYTHASAVLAAFAGAGVLGDSGASLLQLTRKKQNERVGKFRSKGGATVGSQLSFHVKNVSEDARRGSCVGAVSVLAAADENGDLSCTTKSDEGGSSMMDKKSKAAPVGGGGGAGFKGGGGGAYADGGGGGGGGVMSVGMHGDGNEEEDDDSDDDDDDDSDFGTGERIQQVLTQLKHQEKQRVRAQNSRHDALRAEVKESIGGLHRKIDGVLAAFGSAMERMQRNHQSGGSGGGGGGSGDSPVLLPGKPKGSTIDRKLEGLKANVDAKALMRAKSAGVHGHHRRQRRGRMI